MNLTGAADGNRTREILHGKETPYHWATAALTMLSPTSGETRTPKGLSAPPFLRRLCIPFHHCTELLLALSELTPGIEPETLPYQGSVMPLTPCQHVLLHFHLRRTRDRSSPKQLIKHHRVDRN